MRTLGSPMLMALAIALCASTSVLAQETGERGRGGSRDQGETLRRAEPRPPARGGQPVREIPPDRDRDQDKPRTAPERPADPAPSRPPGAPSQLPPATPLLPPSMGAPPQWLFEERIVLDCDTTRVCLLEPLDDYVAWMLSARTTIPWRYLVDARVDAGSWMEAIEFLDIAVWELYVALGQDASTNGTAPPLSDTEVRELATWHLQRIQPPSLSCNLPVELEGVSAYQLDLQNGTQNSLIDAIDEEIAARIADETGWCIEDLLAARKFLGDWARAARELSISPFLFEVSFGIQLDVLDLRTRIVRYPTEEQIRYVARGELWPELTAGPRAGEW